MSREEALRRQYPLHWAVFRKDCEELLELLEDDSSEEFINRLDVRGRTPLMLAVTLGHVNCAKALLEKGADATVQNADMWSLSHEAICSGDAQLLRLILKYRDYQRAVRTNHATERLLRLLKQTDDFYAEMSWEFTSWLPFVSKMCPSDTYKIYKRGSDVRIDTTLVGFDRSTNWKRGNQSFIFRFSEANQAQLLVIDHDRRTATIQTMESDVAEELSDYEPPVEAVYSRMTAPVDTTYVDIDKIGFGARSFCAVQIYKRGSDVRIDTTLVGFDRSTNWKRGNQSFIFRFSEANQAQLLVIDHDRRTATIQTMESDVAEELSDYEPPVEAVYSRMTAPVDTTYVDIDKIGFERSKTGGLLSWITSSDRTEVINGYECKVYNASNVEIVTKTRTEHLLEEDKERYKQEENSNPLHTILRLVEKRQECTEEMKRTGVDVYCGLTPAQYLDKDYSMHDRDIGRPKQVTRKSNSFKATLWLCDNYPLDLQDQILPIIDLMAVNNAHFARLKNFIQLQLPAGFPVKIEIPLFHVVSARITFSSINKLGRYVSPANDPNKVIIDANAFEVADSYRCLSGDDFALDIGASTPSAVDNGHIPGRRCMHFLFFCSAAALNMLFRVIVYIYS
ncbi:Ankyrin repeat domain-containing protein 13A [Toxocara canis]|uniref:Ankyrin repeat domain-containing protein 13A n=1 Tax=Toxocara canis TaxID=6265 RepID=A0A0B2V297_TOXCA|nr:Ankyrin repeat domain-containing protein 13A [Toxocara canis]